LAWQHENKQQAAVLTWVLLDEESGFRLRQIMPAAS
jgi:hypothetical protein